MWWFLKKFARPIEASHQTRVTTASAHSLAEDGLLAQVPDLSALDRHDVTVKIWLPAQVAQTIKWLADYEGVSQSSWIRSQLTRYVYGQVATLAKHIRDEQNCIRFSRAPVDRGAGRWVYLVPQLGKNTVAFKLWMSRQMRDDLDILAKHAGVGLSPFIREAVIGELYGRGSLPERPEIMGAATAEAVAWEGGEDVPQSEVAADEFNDLGEAERVWVLARDAVNSKQS